MTSERLGPQPISLANERRGCGTASSNPNIDIMLTQLIVVCGGGGFIGGHLVGDLRRQGFQHIRAVDIKPLDEWYQTHPEVENLQLLITFSDESFIWMPLSPLKVSFWTVLLEPTNIIPKLASILLSLTVLLVP